MKRINILRKAKKVLLFGLVGLLTLVSGMLNNVMNGDVYPCKSEDRTVGLEAMERSQGVTTDGESWIFSGKTSLVRVSLDNEEILALNKEAIPAEFAQYGSAHIGGISFANGYVYAAIEDSKVWENPIVALFDVENLTFTGKYVLLPGKGSESEYALTRGVPWVTCDMDNGCFYVGECRNTKELYAFDLETFAYIKTIPLQTEVDRIQGAEMYNGRLYAATNDATRAVYQISLRTGEVVKYFDRILYQPKWIENFGGEGEDITVLPMADGTVFHALNIGAMFIDANLRHYAPVPGIDTAPEKIPEEDDPVYPPRPQVTYLDKYVVDILAGSSYTLQAEMNAEDTTFPFTQYKDGDNSATKVRLSSLVGADMPSLGGLDEVRVVIKDSKLYIAWATGYVQMEGQDMEDVINSMKDMDVHEMFRTGELQYAGVISGTGYVCESYHIPEENLGYNFYFTSNGLTRMEVVDLETRQVTETMSMSLKAGVSDKNVFTLSGREYTMEEFEKMFEGIAG